MTSLEEIVSKFPRWSVGVLIAPYMEGGEVIEYYAYPVKKIRGLYYFSIDWNRIEFPFIIGLDELAPCILLKNGEIYGVDEYTMKGRYRYLKVYGLTGLMHEDGDIEKLI